MSAVTIKAMLCLLGVILCAVVGCVTPTGGTEPERLLAERLQAYQRASDPVAKAKLQVELETLVDKYLFHVPRGYLGVAVHRVSVMGTGRLVIRDRTMPGGSVWVARVVAGTPAERAGVQPDDFIVAVDGQRWASGPDGFIEYVQAKHPGDKLELVMLRGTATNAIAAVLGELPASEQARVCSEERRRAFFERWLSERLGRN